MGCTPCLCHRLTVLGRRRAAGLSRPTAFSIPPRTAPGAAGSRRRSRRSFCCVGCAVSASGRPSTGTRQDAPAVCPLLELAESVFRAGLPPRPDFPCVRPFLRFQAPRSQPVQRHTASLLDPPHLQLHGIAGRPGQAGVIPHHRVSAVAR